MYSDIWQSNKAISWLDVGAGYGEIMEAILSLTNNESQVEGLEPMNPKAKVAKQMGLTIHSCYLKDLDKKYDFVSIVHVFSHIPDFRIFLDDIKHVLKKDGEIFIETGNAADLKNRSEVPTELDLPDHLTFAGKEHVIGFLEKASFKIIQLQELRRDDLINFLKNIIKFILGRNVYLRFPYTSGHRAIRIRAKLVQ